MPPLAIPARGDADATASESVTLFVQRALAVRPDFSVDAAALDAITEICRRLDGLPLALELAAARTRLLAPRAILARLENRLELLRSTSVRSSGAAPHDAPGDRLELRPARRRRACAVQPTGDVRRRHLARRRRKRSLRRSAAAAVVRPSSTCWSRCAARACCVSRSRSTTSRGSSMLETVREFALEQLRAVGRRRCRAARASRVLPRARRARRPPSCAARTQAVWLTAPRARLRELPRRARGSARSCIGRRGIGRTSRRRGSRSRWTGSGSRAARCSRAATISGRIVALARRGITGRCSTAGDVALRARLFGAAARMSAATSNFPTRRPFERALVLQRQLHDPSGDGARAQRRGLARAGSSATSRAARRARPRRCRSTARRTTRSVNRCR